MSMSWDGIFGIRVRVVIVDKHQVLHCWINAWLEVQGLVSRASRCSWGRPAKMPTVAKTFYISSIILSEQFVRKGRLSSIT